MQIRSIKMRTIYCINPECAYNGNHRETTTQRGKDMIKFNTKAELIEAKAQQQHEANLERGGVFNEDGSRFSNIESERSAAATMPVWVSAHYAAALKSPAGWVIEGFGYEEA